PAGSEETWFVSGAAYGLYIVFNSVVIAFSRTPWKYFFASMGLSIAFMVVCFVIARGWIVFRNAHGSDEASIVFLIIMYHPVALLCVMFMRWIAGKLKA
ncbi:MAG TPA: hypothetical protein VEB86_15090, partial [Chryseosolibacter sp.]|nr:hypothetical protein [Chryseosolibacter sp.]